MSLFRRKKNRDAAVVYNFVGHKETVLFRRAFTQSPSFRGFRRIKLSSSRIDGHDDTLAHFRRNDFDFKGCEILVECIKIEDGDAVYHRVNVYVDGLLLGRVGEASEESLSMLIEHKYDKAHIKVEEFYHSDGTVMGTNVYLFVHYIQE